MIKKKISGLKDHRHWPCVSIFVPTRPGGVAAKEDAQRVRLLKKEVERRLHNQFNQTISNEFQDYFNHLIEEYNFEKSLEGLAFFISRDVQEWVRLPFSVKEEIAIQRQFLIRVVYRKLLRPEAFFILYLDRQKSSLFETYEWAISSEVRNSAFPYLNDIPAPEAEDADFPLTPYLKRLNDRIEEILKMQPGRMVVVGSKDLFDQLDIIGTGKQSFYGFAKQVDVEDWSALGKAAWELVLEWMDEQRRRAFEELPDAIEGGRYENDLNDIWQALHEGKGDFLLVESDYYQLGYIEGGRIVPVVESDADRTNFDIINEIIERSLEKKVTVIFVDGDHLSTLDRIGLITRY